jgi:type I restriction enzyme S subunit
MKSQTEKSGEIPFYKIGTFGGTSDAYISRRLFEEYKAKYSYPKKGDILISAAGTIGRSVIFDGEEAYFQDSNIVWIDNDESQVINKYLYHYYQIVDWKTDGGTIKRLYNGNLAATPIPIPPLALQEKIVSILDRFESLVNDLTAGLPAEIEARRQQYDYYRNQLLTFKRLA